MYRPTCTCSNKSIRRAQTSAKVNPVSIQSPNSDPDDSQHLIGTALSKGTSLANFRKDSLDQFFQRHETNGEKNALSQQC